MKQMNKILVFITIILLSSCSENKDNWIDNESDINKMSTSIEEVKAKSEFSAALSQALSDSKEFREIIKNEALKKITYDYDVLYSLIKNNILTSGESVECLLSKYIDLDQLRLIENKYPTLTIFVPSLPVNSFSAEKWNTDIEIPAVSYVTSKDTEGISVIFPNGDKDLIDIELIPTYPIVVVKENERIIRAEISNSTKKPIYLKSIMTIQALHPYNFWMKHLTI